MAHRYRTLTILVGLWIAFAFAAWAGVPKRSPAPTPSGGVLPKVIRTGSTAAVSSKLIVTARGSNYALTARRASDEEWLVQVNEASLRSLANVFASSLKWDDRRGLTVKRGGEKYTLGLGQQKMPVELGGRDLEACCQVIDGTPYAPLSGVGDMLGVRFTVKKDGKTACADPLINDIHLEWNGDKQHLIVEAEHEVSFKTFSLKKPERFVIDVDGGALNVESLNIYHPKLGVIRLGQFSFNPTVTRVVIPMVSGYAVKPQSKARSKKLVFAIDDYGAEMALPSINFSEQRLTRCNVEEKNGKSVVNLRFSGPIQYEWTRLISPDYRFFVDLHNVVLSGAKQELDVRNKGVRSVRVSQNSRQPQAKTRVVLDMSSPFEVQVVPGDDGMSLAIEIGTKTVAANTELIKGSGYTNGAGTASSTSSGAAPVVIFQPATTNPSGTVRTICIDPGHGGADSGAYNRMINLAEEDVTLDVSMRLTELLRRQGWKVVMTREDDRDVSYPGSSDSEELWARAKAGNECGADLFVSLHCNSAASSAAEGTSIHVYKQSDKVFGDELITPLINHTGRRNRGVSQDRFYVLAHTNMPAVLVEMAFISNNEEGRLLGDPAFRQRIAEGLAEGIANYAARYLQGRPAAVQPTISTPAPKKSYITTRSYEKAKRNDNEGAVLPQSVLK